MRDIVMSPTLTNVPPEAACKNPGDATVRDTKTTTSKHINRSFIENPFCNYFLSNALVQFTTRVMGDCDPGGGIIRRNFLPSAVTSNGLPIGKIRRAGNSECAAPTSRLSFTTFTSTATSVLSLP